MLTREGPLGDPYSRLAYAVLLSGIKEQEAKYVTANNAGYAPKHLRERSQANRAYEAACWVRSESTEAQSFVWYCRLIGVSPDEARRIDATAARIKLARLLGRALGKRHA